MPERERERAILKAHASRTAPELEEFERHLKCVIEGIGKDQILVRFTHIDPLDRVREFSIVVDVTESTYKSTSHLTNHRFYSLTVICYTVPTASPLPPTLPFLLDELNDSRDIYAFIKHVRHAFEQLASQGR